MARPAQIQIAVVGGDSRTERLQWPEGYEVTCYQGQRYGGDGQLRGLRNALTAGRYAAVVLVVRWMGHSMFKAVRDAAACRVITWDRGVGDLAKNLNAVFAEKAS